MGALWNTRGLSWPSAFEQHRQKAGDLDLLDWLRAMFGFQVCCNPRLREREGEKKEFCCCSNFGYSMSFHYTI